MSEASFVRMTAGAAGLLAVLGGAVACVDGADRPAAGSSACAKIRERISTGQAVDADVARRCDRAEFAALEYDRRTAAAMGEERAMRTSATCQTVNERAAQGDPALDFGLAFHCRGRERLAGITNAVGGLGPANTISSLCLGARARQARGAILDAFTDSLCGREEAAAGVGRPGDAAQGAGGKAGPTQRAAPAASGE